LDCCTYPQKEENQTKIFQEKIKMNYNIIILTALFISLIAVAAFAGFALADSQPQKVYIHSVIGCLPLNDEYTFEQFVAKQNFMAKYTGYVYSPCN
jgi:hypothetical protein